MPLPKIIFIVGPTASGKSAVAMELAQKIGGEIISADSMQVYAGLDILSAKPSREDREKIPHHLIDILNPTENYNAAIFREHVLRLLPEIISRGNVPIIVGGTGLYVKSLTRGLFAQEGWDPLLRKELKKIAAKNGSLFLHNRLKEVDPQTAEKIHHNDLMRIIRALEVYEVTKETISDLKTQVEGIGDIYDLKLFGLDWERAELYQRIEQRVDLMFEAGLVAEVKKLKSLKLSQTAAQALGIKQIIPYLDNKASIEEVTEILKRDTRRFAKRQLTWFRQQEKGLIWMDCAESETSLSDITCGIMLVIKKGY